MRRQPLFPMARIGALYLVPIKSYLKSTHLPSFLKWAVVSDIISKKYFENRLIIIDALVKN